MAADRLKRMIGQSECKDDLRITRHDRWFPQCVEPFNLDLGCELHLRALSIQVNTS